MRFLILVLVLSLNACVTARRHQLCQNEGVVLKIAGLDGCDWLILSKDGRRLLPENARDFHWEDQQSINFSYQKFKGMSICMAEDEIVTLTCLEISTNTPCKDELEIENISWLKDIIYNENPVSVYRFSDSHRFLFKMTKADRTFSWFDCHGYLICQSTGGCDLNESDVTDKTTIFLAHR